MNKLEDLNSEKKDIHVKGAIYLLIDWLEKKAKISFSFPLWNLYGPWCQKWLFPFFKSRILVLKDLTVEALKNAFSEHVLKEEIHKHRKLSYPYLQSSNMIKPFCLRTNTIQRSVV